MEKNLSIGTLAAAPGEKVQGLLPIPHTEIEVPVTLINGAGSGKNRPHHQRHPQLRIRRHRGRHPAGRRAGPREPEWKPYSHTPRQCPGL